MSTVWWIMSQNYVWKCLVFWVFPKDVVLDNVTTKHFNLTYRFQSG